MSPSAEANVHVQSSQSINRSNKSDASTGTVEEEDLMTMYMDDVIEINDELMKVAMQIRSPNLRGSRHKAYPRGTIQDDDQDAYTRALESFRRKGIEQTLLSARRRTMSLYQVETSISLRDSDEFLVDRLSKANDYRRRQFDYWRKYRSHSAGATTNAAVAADADNSHDDQQPQAMLNTTADVAFVKPDQKAPKTVSMPSVSFLAPDFKLRSVRSARTHQSRALTVHAPGGDLIAWPEVISRAEFRQRLSNLPEEALDRSIWITNVVQHGAREPEFEPREQDWQKSTSQQEERLRSHLQPATLPCFMVDRNRDSNFVGRQGILEAVDDILVRSAPGFDRNRGRNALLSGIGGIGKSSIAAEFVYSRKNKFDAIFWIRGLHLADLEEDFANIAHSLNLKGSSELNDLTMLRSLAMGRLEHPIKFKTKNPDSVHQKMANWLLVFDDLRKPEFLHNHWPLSSTGSILVTSRRAFWEPPRSGTLGEIKVEIFGHEESAALLKRICPDISQVDAFKLAQKLRGLPLSIVRMAACIRRQDLDIDEYMKDFKDQGPRTQAFVIGQLEPEARALLEVCSVLGFKHIQESIFTSSIPNGEILSGLLRSRPTYLSARATLLQGSFMQNKLEEKDSRDYPLVHDPFWWQTSPEQEVMVLSNAIHLLYIAQEILDRQDPSQIIPHIVRLEQLVGKMDRSLDRSVQIHFAELLVKGGWWLHDRGMSSEAEPLMISAISVGDKLGAVDELLFDILHLWTTFTSETNETTGPLLRELQLLNISHTLGTDKLFAIKNQRIIKAQNRLEVASCLIDRFDEALNCFRISIELQDKLGDHSFIDPRLHMAFAYLYLGNLMEADRILHRRQGRGRIANAYEAGQSCYALGNIRHAQGKLQESRELHEQALEQYQSTLDSYHHKIADLNHKIAQHYIREGRFEKARDLIDKGLKIYSTQKRHRQPEIARTTFLEAILEEKCGNAKKVARLTRRARAMRNKLPHATVKTEEETLTEADFDELVAFFAR
ncbi:MAG: hypothetical protein Q9221_004930 [Calogaya cf. arnoldii]